MKKKTPSGWRAKTKFETTKAGDYWTARGNIDKLYYEQLKDIKTNERGNLYLEFPSGLISNTPNGFILARVGEKVKDYPSLLVITRKV